MFCLIKVFTLKKIIFYFPHRIFFLKLFFIEALKWKKKSIFILIIHFPLMANPEKNESIQNIRIVAEQFLASISRDENNIKLTVHSLDPRLTLKKCHHPLKASLSKGSRKSGRMNIMVQCSKPVAWKVFVSAKKEYYQSVVIANRALSKGDLLLKHDLRYQKIKMTHHMKAVATDIKQVLFSTPKHFIREKSIIYLRDLCMVCRGDKVQVLAGNEFFSVYLDAQALNNGMLGENIRLKNMQSHRIFMAQIIGRQKVRVKLLTQ
jgi:flagella basal body P-ring formation protein FlgA